ncbi:glycosyltransferase family 2 protein [uncultured Roseobacter sp.]|uniref:glycosyltransferase family 2 protein n=1 Tax=uncultured Roseobacter sp. TaxID=114847 RepID=UPI002618A1F4|nr:glycosyltransferase family 2 protein [uncultured Roseobacter sp.]
MTYILSQFDDLTLVSARQPDPEAFTLCAIGRNEMFFLPAFLEHYRKLGVEQFAILDDRSDDGTLEYLLAQPDVVVFHSRFAYGDTVKLPSALSDQINSGRILYIWRALFFNRFARRGWAVQVDLDEFIHLPAGKRFQDIALQLETEGSTVAYGLMLDVYPTDIAALGAQAHDREIDMGAAWYFDGEPHFRLRQNASPKVLHPGARARLYRAYGTDRLYAELGLPVPQYRNWVHRMRKTRFGTRIPFYNAMQKPVLAHWSDEAIFTSSHNVNVPVSSSMLIPFQHFRFSGALYAKIDMALTENSYSSGSRDHRLLTDLLARMKETDGSFLYKKSQPVTGHAGFEAARVAFGL